MQRVPSRESRERLGPYELVQRLGAGGMGEVWEAVLHGPSGFRKSVALKLLRPGVVDADSHEGLAREARLGASLQHPNVVSTLGLGEYGGTWCVALELVRGVSLSRLLVTTGGALPPGAVVEVGLQTAAALHHIHELVDDDVPSGLVHRDVKPANLLLDRAGIVKLADLGISSLRGERTRAAGTPGYLAPEQADGRAEPRSDLFSLGATLFLLATGQRPFGAGSRAVEAGRRVEERLRSEGFLAPVRAVAPGLDVVLRRCLRADPAERYPSARELWAALAALRARQPPGPSLFDLVGRAAPELRRGEAFGVLTPTSEVPTRIVPLGNLPRPRDAFVGRTDEVEELERLVGTERWLVLVGPGGVGKTRLALELGRRVRGTLAGGAWALDLTDARTVEGVCSAVAAGLGIQLERTDPAGQLGRALAARGRALFVLDNLEQCVDALRETVGRWLDAAPDATLLGTSRIVPRLQGERVVPLGELVLADAMTLFRERAPRPLTPEELGEVEAVCVALEQIPLSLELAAARLRLLDLSVVRERLGLALLGGGARDRPERHRSLAASLGWSWGLLSEAARSGLGQLTVFDGGFTLQAAESVLDLRRFPGSPWALEALQELVDASLMRVDPQRGRFSMLVVVREFAAEAIPPDERAAAERRHVHHFAQLGTVEAIEALSGRDGHERYLLLRPELDNLVTACRRSVELGSGSAAAATLAAAGSVLVREGPPTVYVDLARRVATMSSLAPAEIARVAELAGRAMAVCGRPDEARAHYERGLALVRQDGDLRRQAVLLGHLGTLNAEQGRLSEATACLERSLALSNEAGYGGDGMVLANLGTAIAQQGRQLEALAHYERALVLLVASGNRQQEAAVTCCVATVELVLGRTADALDHFERALVVFRELDDRRFEGMVLGNLGNLHSGAGRQDLALASYERALELHRESGNRRFEAHATLSIGQTHTASGDLAAARAHVESALRIFREVDDRRFEAYTLCQLANLERDAGRLPEARAHYESALIRLDGVGDPHTEGVLRSDLGLLDALEARLPEARLEYERALSLLRHAGSRSGEGGVLHRLARLVAEVDGPDVAAPLLEQAESILREVHDVAALSTLLLERAEATLRAGDRDRARALWEEARLLGSGLASVEREVERVGDLLDRSI